MQVINMKDIMLLKLKTLDSPTCKFKENETEDDPDKEERT